MSIQKLINECSWKHYLSELKGGNNPNIHQLIYGQVKCGEGNGNPLQCSCLENPRDGGAWCAWRIPGTGEPGGLLSVGSHRVGHD